MLVSGRVVAKQPTQWWPQWIFKVGLVILWVQKYPQKTWLRWEGIRSVAGICLTSFFVLRRCKALSLDFFFPRGNIVELVSHFCIQWLTGSSKFIFILGRLVHTNYCHSFAASVSNRLRKPFCWFDVTVWLHDVLDWTGWNDELMKPTNTVIHGKFHINWSIPWCPLNFDFQRTEAFPHGLTCCWSRFPTAAWEIINLKYGAVGVDFHFCLQCFPEFFWGCSHQPEVQLLNQIADLNRHHQKLYF